MARQGPAAPDETWGTRISIQPEASTSTLSTIGGSGLEDLAEFVRRSSAGGSQNQAADDSHDQHFTPHHKSEGQRQQVLSRPAAQSIQHEHGDRSVPESPPSPKRLPFSAAPSGDQQSSIENPFPFRGIESLAQLTVKSLTESALQRSANSSLLGAGKTRSSLEPSAEALRTDYLNGHMKAGGEDIRKRSGCKDATGPDARTSLAAARGKSAATNLKTETAEANPIDTATSEGLIDGATEEGLVTVSHKCVESSELVAYCPRNLVKETLGHRAAIRAEDSIETGLRQKVGGGNSADGTRSRAGGDDVGSRDKAVKSCAGNETGSGSRENGRGEYPSHEYSLDNFEKENGSVSKSGSSSGQSSSDDLDGYQRRRDNPQYAGKGTFMAIISAHSSRLSLSAPSSSQGFESPDKFGSETRLAPKEKVAGIADFQRELTAWFNSEVLKPSTVAAVAAKASNSGDRVHNVGSSSLHPADNLFGSPGMSSCVSSDDGTHSMSGESLVQNHTAVAVAQSGTQTRSQTLAVDTSKDNQSIQKRRQVHPARLFHFLWQRDRLRCPFSRCAIPDTVVFDSMGEAVDWFFTSKREGGIKRKLSSNTRLSHIFKTFSEGSEDEGDPVAVLISWNQIRGEDHAPLSPEADNGGALASIGHMNARELYVFLFGTSLEGCTFPTTDHKNPEVGARRGKRQLTGQLTKYERHHGNRRTPDLNSCFPRAFGVHVSGGGLAVESSLTGRYSERSKAAAKAAGEGVGSAEGGDESGWCLLQKFIGPSGSRSSTLRCQWTAPPPSWPNSRSQGPQLRPEGSQGCPAMGTDGTAINAGAVGVVKNAKYRWGSAEEVEMSFRERSTDRSPFRNRPDTVGLEIGVAEGASVSGGVHGGSLLERSTNVFRICRNELSIEDRCVTFEEPSPASRGGLWPRSVREPLRGAAIRETLVEACAAVADHVSQVTKDAFRPKAATGYFRQGSDGRTYLMFLSRWGQIPGAGQAPCELRLTRVLDELGATACEWVGQGRQTHQESEICRQEERKVPLLIRRTEQGDQTLGKNEGWERQLKQSMLSPGRLVCPGCGRAGVRGGVRCIDGGAGAPYDKPKVQDEGTDTHCKRTIDGAVERSPGKSSAVRTSKPECRPSFSGSTACDAVGGTFHTSFGVIVDVCTWWRREHDMAGGKVECGHETRSAKHTTYPGDDAEGVAEETWGRNPKARAGISRCVRMLSRLHPGVSPEQMAERCADDLRLRLGDVAVCRECALAISNASEARLRDMDNAARRAAGDLATPFGTGREPWSERERMTRVLDDIRAFRRRLTSAPLETSETGSQQQNGFVGVTRPKSDRSIKQQHVHFPRRPLGGNLGRRPRTTDGVSPRQQVFNHPSRKIVSATAHSSDRTTPKDGHHGGPVESTIGEGINISNVRAMGGSCCQRYTNGEDRHLGSRDSAANSNAGDNCGCVFGGDGGDFRAGGNSFLFTESEGFTSQDETGVDRSRCERLTGSASPTSGRRQQSCRDRRRHKGVSASNGAVSSGNFHDPYEIAYRYRRVFDAYGGASDDLEGKRRSVSPRHVGKARPTKSASPVREKRQQQQRLHISRSARTSRRRGIGNRRRNGPPSCRNGGSLPSSGSKALQWATAMCTRVAARANSSNARHPRLFSCPPQRYEKESESSAGRLAIGDIASTRVEPQPRQRITRRSTGCSSVEDDDDGRANCDSEHGDNDDAFSVVPNNGGVCIGGSYGECDRSVATTCRARTGGARDRVESTNVDQDSLHRDREGSNSLEGDNTGHGGEDGNLGTLLPAGGVHGVVGTSQVDLGSRVSAADGAATATANDPLADDDYDDYSNASFAPESSGGTSTGSERGRESHQSGGMRGGYGGNRCNLGGDRSNLYNHDTVDGIPSTVVETGREIE